MDHYRIGYKDLSPEERRRIDKQYVYLKTVGKGRLVDAKPVLDHIIKLHDQYRMTYRYIAEQSGVDECRIRAIRRGEGRYQMPLNRVRRSTYERILAVKPVRVEYKGKNRMDYGPRVNPIGTQRRLQAMRADGFPVHLIAELVGRNRSAIYDLSTPGRHGGEKFVYQRTHDIVREVYENYELKTPEDLGYTDMHGMNMTRTYARRRGFAPRMCWDYDTIDDPDAIPEYTGQCGTYQGAYLHRKHRIPLCTPCREAASARTQELKQGTPSEKRGRKRESE